MGTSQRAIIRRKKTRWNGRKILCGLLVVCLILLQISITGTAKTITVKKTYTVGTTHTISKSKVKKSVKWTIKKGKTKIKVTKKSKKKLTFKCKKKGNVTIYAKIGKKTYCYKIVIKSKKKQSSSSKSDGNTSSDASVGQNDAKDANEKKDQASMESQKEETSELFATHSGEGTYYDGGYVGGCANLDSMTQGYYVCAMNTFDYNKGALAGAYIRITGPKGSVDALVTDELPEGKKGDVDLNENAFPKIANKVDGRVPITWKIIALPTTKPIQYMYKAESTQYWMQVQVRNQKYPVAKLEMKQSDGSFKALPRENYNYFTVDKPGNGPFTFRVTDYKGTTLTDTVTFSPGKAVDGSKNF